MSILRKDTTPSPSRRNRYNRLLTIAIIVVVAFLGAAAALLAARWPFTPPKMTARLESATSGSVRFGGFQTKYFPPGCVIEALELRPPDGAGTVPLMTVRRLTILSNYRQLLLHQRIEVMHLEDLHFDMSRRKELKSGSAQGNGNGASNSSSNDFTSIAEIIVDRGIIEYPRHDRPALIFNVHQLTLDNVLQGKRISFHVTLDNPLPPGNVRADGQFDPWNVSDMKETPLSGTYRFTDAKLDTLGGIAGTLSSQGSFAGPADALRVQGKTDTPDYQVKSAGHPLHLRTEFEAVVNCSNGDVALRNIQGQFEKTSFGVAGDVTGKTSARSKVASLQAADPEGRIEDWLRLLTSDQTPAMTGPISFQVHMTIPGGRKPFIRRVHLEGDFGITEAAFTSEETQENIAELSLRAQGQKVPDRKPDPKNDALPKITGNLSGHVELLDGVAHFSNLAYSLPGVVARVQGTYSLTDEKVDLHGEMRVETKFSKTASGPKALLTRAAEGLLAKGRGRGEILPVKLTGTYGHPSYGLDK